MPHYKVGKKHMAYVRALELENVKQSFPNKRIAIVIPIGRHAGALKQVAHAHMKVKVKHLETCQFPDEIREDGLAKQEQGLKLGRKYGER